MLTQFVRWATSLPEYPKASNENRLHPSFSFFYTTRRPSWIRKLRNKFFPTLSSFSFFQKLLEKVTKDRIAQGYQGDFIHKLSPPANARFILFGDYFGAFHSLIRNLQELHKQGFIDENLRLKKPTDFMIFNGNLINSSPYNIEILTVALFLLSQNPTQVFYIRGSHENHEEWHNFPLKEELLSIGKEFSNSHFPLNTEINAFFDTLPLAVYMKILSTDKVNIVRISHFADLSESDFAPFLTQNDERAHAILSLDKLSFPKTSLPLQLFFKGVDRTFNYHVTTGFEFVLTELGTSVCSLFSAPTASSQELYHFYNDSFVVFQPSNWSLQHYTQDVRSLKGFSVETFNLEKLNYAGLTKDKLAIHLGCTMDLSKSSSFLGFRLKEGISLGAAECNHFGGVNNQPISPIFLDDEYTPYKALNNVQNFLQLHHTDLILSPLGTPTTESFLPLAQEKKILILFPYTGASIFRKPELTHIVHFRTSYNTETEALIHYAYNHLLLKKFAVFYQDDFYGQAGLEGARKAFAKMGIQTWHEVPYQRNSPNIKAAADSIQDFNPESIIFISTYAPSVSLVQALTPAQLHNKALMGISFLTDLFRDFLTSRGLPFIISRVIPDATKPVLEIVHKYQTAMQTYNHSSIYTSDSLEGYINILLFTDIIRLITPPITKEKIIQQVEQLKNYSFYGLNLDFDPNTRTLFHQVWVDTGDKEWIPFKDSERS